MKQLLIIIFLLCSFTSYSQRIQDQFTKQNWSEFYILTENSILVDIIEDENGYTCPVYQDEQGFCYFVTINEGHVFTIDINCFHT